MLFKNSKKYIINNYKWLVIPNVNLSKIRRNLFNNFLHGQRRQIFK